MPVDDARAKSPGVDILACMSRAISERARAELWARVPEGRPFTALEGTELGISVHWLRTWACQGRLRRPVRGVYVRLGVRDTLDLRLQVLRLVVPPDCVVTDRTAAWLWGAPMVLAPGDHLQAPRVSVFAPPGRRLRNDLSRSGERMFSTEDVVARDGVLVTTPLRTACDVLRLLHRDQAIAVSDMLASVGAFEVERLSSELVRFKGYRGVIQARALAPLIDAGSGSPGESILRMRWYDAGLPRPTSQVEVAAPGGSYFVDLGLPRGEVRCGVLRGGISRDRRSRARREPPEVDQRHRSLDGGRHPQGAPIRAAPERRTAAEKRLQTPHEVTRPL